MVFFSYFFSFNCNLVIFWFINVYRLWSEEVGIRDVVKFYLLWGILFFCWYICIS